MRRLIILIFVKIKYNKAVMNNVKAVFFDLDGTLLTPTRGIAASTRQAIIDMRRSGILVGIATGRGPAFAAPLLEELNLNFAVTYNGQYILDSKNVYYENPMEKRLISKIIRYAADNHRDLSFGKADGIVGSGLLKFGETRTAGYIAGILPGFVANFARTLFKNFVRQFRPVVYNLHKLMKDPIYQIMMVSTADESDKLVEKFPGLAVTRSNPYSADLLTIGTSKLRGIKRLGDIFDFSLTEVMCFGDSENDMEMLDGAGYGVAMGNARPAVKEIADHITTSNGADGIAKALAYYGLIEYQENESFISKDIEYNLVKEFHRLMDGKTQEVPRLFSMIEAEHRAAFEIEEIVEFLKAVSGSNLDQFENSIVQMHKEIDRAAEKVMAKPADGLPLTQQTDSLIDLLYFVYGSLVLSGVDSYEIFRIVHKANMAKIFPDGKPHFDSNSGKLLKPDNWKAKYSPERDIQRELERQTRVADRKADKRKESQ
ncbi:MAG: Cof-type HAD-IIB family hydrolase [Streptococcaceae bacterium]|jgi:Cof subfamily protein (haloacid dehalogenase superfamily)|nr:Cof-type HAD-IIB family hydrolase [Streptococcaceae bacterium]